ncbi:MAG: PHP domain-containing protein, partial [Erysipelotrichaceae bacterium]|nr:PHP domain-containing protein [Erysipelotrichaceae bacterium]
MNLLNVFLNEMKYSDEQRRYFDGCFLEDACFRRAANEVILKLHAPNVLPYQLYRDLFRFLKETLKNEFELKMLIRTDEQDLPLREACLYLNEFAEKNRFFREAALITEGDKLCLSYTSKDAYNEDMAALEELHLFFQDIGYTREFAMLMNDISVEPEEVVVRMRPEAKKEEPAKPAFQKNYYNKRANNYTEVRLSDLKEELDNIQIDGKIFKVEERTSMSGNLSQTIYVKDDSDACIVRVREGRRFSKDDLSQNKEGKCAKFYGSYHYDKFFRDYVFEPSKIEYYEEEPIRDNAPEKRIELHAHSNKSEMDGVCDPEEIVTAAFKMGHSAVAITDHNVVQAFPIAQRTAQSLKKGSPDREFKILYGCEFNMAESRLYPVYNPRELAIQQAEYIVFDLETTGLSARHDRIIEFGAVRMYRGNIMETKDFFVNPGMKLPEHIRTLTNIRQEDVDNARTFAEVKDELLDFIKGKVLVAHNASFDFSFLNEELKRMGEPELDNTVIDTLDLAKQLLKNMHGYRLGRI